MEEQVENRNLPVLASAPDARPVTRPEPMPLAQPVAAATGGLLAGIGALVLMRALRTGFFRRRSSAVRLGRGRGNKLDIAASRSFLVDVHVLSNKR